MTGNILKSKDNTVNTRSPSQLPFDAFTNNDVGWHVRFQTQTDGAIMRPFYSPLRVVRQVLLLLAAPLIVASCDANKVQSDPQQVSQSIRSMFETPDNPIHLEPIVAVSTFAVAGWIQGERGGRALLRKRNGEWNVVLCSGDALTRADMLTNMGVPNDVAVRIATQVVEAESRMTAAQRKLLSSFGETVIMDEAHADHEIHSKH